MKTLRIIIIWVVLIGFGYMCWVFSAPKSADAPMKAAVVSAPAVKMNTSTATPPNASVAPPITPPVAVAAAKVAPTPSNTASKFDYQPQPDLNGCLDQTIKLLEAQDVLSLVKTLMPPDVLQRMIASGRVASMEDVAALYSARPDVNQVMGQLQQVLVSVKSQTPELNSDGTQASYKMDASVSDYKGPGEDNGNIVFVKVQGNWYLK